ncbi:hypothetical protein BZL30_4361 [Mycobacterium kansasii]|uniref:Uncharacterized protein n=1 Tax=Mycobacterium kansasii TaxID=1768 RepID=A0A1V3X4S3_MYCKA|nr:hypothetical protein BZL30_4361 [Mycobacterium kansasii]
MRWSRAAASTASWTSLPPSGQSDSGVGYQVLPILTAVMPGRAAAVLASAVG